MAITHIGKCMLEELRQQMLAFGFRHGVSVDRALRARVTGHRQLTQPAQLLEGLNEFRPVVLAVKDHDLHVAARDCVTLSGRGA